MVESKYLVGDILAMGSYGHIFKAVDTNVKNSHLVIKMTKHHDINDIEFNTLLEVNQVAQYCGITDVIPKVFSKGGIVILDPLMIEKENPAALNTFEYYEQNLWSYMIIEQLGDTLEHLLEERKAPLSFKTTI